MLKNYVITGQSENVHILKKSLFVLLLQSKSEISFTVVHEQNFNLRMKKWRKVLLPNNTVLSLYQYDMQMFGTELKKDWLSFALMLRKDFS